MTEEKKRPINSNSQQIKFQFNLSKYFQETEVFKNEMKSGILR